MSSILLFLYSFLFSLLVAEKMGLLTGAHTCLAVGFVEISYQFSVLTYSTVMLTEAHTSLFFDCMHPRYVLLAEANGYDYSAH